MGLVYTFIVYVLVKGGSGEIAREGGGNPQVALDSLFSREGRDWEVLEVAGSKLQPLGQISVTPGKGKQTSTVLTH